MSERKQLETFRTDVCVIGAGPAGAAASVFLGRKGVPHILLDKHAFPRDKVCGDALTFNVFYMLNKLEEGWVERELLGRPEFWQSWGMRLYTSRNRPYDLDFYGEAIKYAPFLTCPRAKLDALLLEKIDRQYADFHQNAGVQSVRRTEGGFEVEFEQHGERKRLFARLLIGADGERSVVRSSFGQRPDKGQNYGAALRQYYTGVDFSDNPHGLLEVYFTQAITPGYFWVFPLPDGRANVGMGMHTVDIRRHRVKLRELFKRIVAEHPVIAPKFKNAQPADKLLGWGLPFWNDRQEISGEGYLLCGDAASLVDFFTGEGIGNAMISGMIAAKHAAQALETGQSDAATLSAYDREVYRRFGAEMRFAKTAARLATRPALFNATVHMLAGTPLFWAVKRGIRRFFNRWM